ncbi:hypothetical protein DEJ49_17730 [Streptomyces venezuelae]|uniref:Uncharacterized protein n=1 Tax=Streptomyces venezuelae TaxID=54571 RepID=A0A5P2CI91_STRVZ|nr:hypothetical protein [Streptomyces venezuelae]QES42574.1 hypothetical protein DEJ49_17730 [Streptomyces venezuelae]
MGKPDTRHLDRQIRETTRKLDAARQRQMWPLNGRERRAILAAMTSVSVKVARHKSTDRDVTKADQAWESAATRLQAEITALETERQNAVNAAAAEKAAKTAKKSSGWW